MTKKIFILLKCLKFSQIEQSIIVYFEWEPSQNGLSFVFLQLHKKTSLLSMASNLTGVLPVSLCEPSQKGCLLEKPQLHQ